MESDEISARQRHSLRTSKNQQSTAFKVGEVVRQGYVALPLLFNIYGEYIIRKAVDGWKGEVTIQGNGYVTFDTPTILF